MLKASSYFLAVSVSAYVGISKTSNGRVHDVKGIVLFPCCVGKQHIHVAVMSAATRSVFYH